MTITRPYINAPSVFVSHISDEFIGNDNRLKIDNPAERFTVDRAESPLRADRVIYFVDSISARCGFIYAFVPLAENRNYRIIPYRFVGNGQVVYDVFIQRSFRIAKGKRI